jgi:RND family efflux transporter MFP subunit
MESTSTSKTDTLDVLRIARRPERQSRTASASRLVLINFLVVTGLVAAGYALYIRSINRPLAVETFVVAAAPGRQPGILLTGSGYVVTQHKYIIVGTKILGQIVEEPIEEGQRVKMGNILARIDDRDYQAQLRQSIADRDVAQANVRLWLAKAARQRELYATGVISRDDLDTSENALAIAQATLKKDEAAIEYAKFEVNQCVIVSPISGVVLQKYREVGDTINYGGQVQAGGGATDIVQLADTSDMRAEVDINESDIAKLSLGAPAVVIPDAYPQARFDAKLVKIYPEADRQKATVKVEVQIVEPNLAMIKPEMSVKTNFLEKRAAAKEQTRLVIPANSIQHEGSESYVWTVRNGTARRISIAPGGETESGVEVRQGLQEGDVLIIAPPTSLTEGERVRAAAH